MDVLASLAGGSVGLDAWLVSSARLSVFFCFLLQENQVMITLPRAKENGDFHGMREEGEGTCDSVDEEHYRRISNFLLISSLKTNVPVRSSRDGVGNNRSIPALMRLSRIRFKLKIEPGI